MQIFFLRHANAGEPKLNPAKDEKRPLDKLGIEQSHDVGRALAALNITVDVILSSPLKRAMQTASVVANEIDHEEKVLTDNALRPGATYEQFQDLLRRYSRKDAIMVVGHNPTMTEFLSKMVGAAPGTLEMKKGAIARVEKEGRRAAVLKWCMPPKLVRSVQQASASSSRPKTVSK
ncbi:MAG TPA: phosphohistidine phosphatase SixA [Verrucomicrobiae bacterium]|jgi:phosphohistidine phosphatase|nr:phosphohistidine phosphatase SixA [Verrucomicrobiae bacterium]